MIQPFLTEVTRKGGYTLARGSGRSSYASLPAVCTSARGCTWSCGLRRDQSIDTRGVCELNEGARLFSGATALGPHAPKVTAHPSVSSMNSLAHRTELGRDQTLVSWWSAVYCDRC